MGQAVHAPFSERKSFGALVQGTRSQLHDLGRAAAGIVARLSWRLQLLRDMDFVWRGHPFAREIRRRPESFLENTTLSTCRAGPHPGLRLLVRWNYPRMRRRTIPAKPIKPIPNRDMVPGSGTEVIGPFEANPVFGPQPPPEALQKWIATPVNWSAMRP